MSKEAHYTVRNSLGLHARAAATLVQEANRYKSQVFIQRERDEVNAKSIMGVLMLAATQGTELLVRCEGPDEQQALEAIGRLFEDGFGEE